jgi:galactokinase
VEVFAPGRVNLIGEHTDYNGGLVLPFAIGLGLTLRLSWREAETGEGEVGGGGAGGGVRCESTFDGTRRALSSAALTRLVEACLPEPLTSSAVELPADARGTTLAYAVGSLALFLAQGRCQSRERVRALLGGRATIVIDIDSTLPVGGGLSSSAALCAGLLLGYQALLCGDLDARELAVTAMHVEHRFAGAHTGLMDQLAVLLGRPGSYLAVDFARFPAERACEVELTRAHAAFDAYVPLAFHTGVAHSLAGSEYNLRRAQCADALALLTAAARAQGDTAMPTSLSTYSQPDAFTRLFGHPHADAVSGMFPQEDAARVLAQGPLSRASGGTAHAASTLSTLSTLAARATHVVYENLRVRAAMEALRGGDLETLGRLMRESHASLRDAYAVSCAELDAAVEIVPAEAVRLARAAGDSIPRAARALPVIGARMTGGGFGGSTIQLVHAAIVDDLVAAFERPDNPYTRSTGATPRAVVSRPADGARLRYL